MRCGWQVCSRRVRQQMDNVLVLLPIVKALQNSSLQPVHWERLQALLGDLKVGPGTDITLEQLVAAKVRVTSLLSMDC